MYTKAVYTSQKHNSLLNVVEPINLFIVTMHSVGYHRNIEMRVQNNFGELYKDLSNSYKRLFC